MKNLNKKVLTVSFLILLGLGSIYFVATFALPRVLVSVTKAAPSNKISVSQSLLIGEKVMSIADGEDACIVNVFIRDSKGIGIEGKRASLTGAPNITTVNAVSDKDGMVKFEIRSKVEKQFKLSAGVDGAELAKGITVTFHN